MAFPSLVSPSFIFLPSLLYVSTLFCSLATLQHIYTGRYLPHALHRKERLLVLCIWQRVQEWLPCQCYQMHPFFRETQFMWSKMFNAIAPSSFFPSFMNLLFYVQIVTYTYCSVTNRKPRNKCQFSRAMN